MTAIESFFFGAGIGFMILGVLYVTYRLACKFADSRIKSYYIREILPRIHEQGGYVGTRIDAIHKRIDPLEKEFFRRLAEAEAKAFEAAHAANKRRRR